MLHQRAAAGPRLNPCGVGALPPTMLFLEGLLFVADLLRTLCNICLDKLTTLSLRLFPPLKPFERRDHFPEIHDIIGRTQGPTLLRSNDISEDLMIHGTNHISGVLATHGANHVHGRFLKSALSDVVWFWGRVFRPAQFQSMRSRRHRVRYP